MEPSPLVEIPAVGFTILQPSLTVFGKAAQKLDRVFAAVLTRVKLIAVDIYRNISVPLPELQWLRNEIILLDGGQGVRFSTALHFKMLFRAAIRTGVPSARGNAHRPG